MNLVIVAGGKGSRLGHLTKKTPKPLLKVSNQTFLENIIYFYSKFNIDKIYLMVGYKAEQIVNQFHNKIFNGIKVICIKERKPLGNFGCLYKLKSRIKNKFFLYANGDSMLNINVNDLIKKNFNFMCLTKAEKHNRYKLSINKKLIVPNIMGRYKFAGLMLMSTKLLKYSKNNFQNFETDILPKIFKSEKIFGKLYKEFFIDIGLKKNLFLLRKKLRKKDKAIFLDRDGTINTDDGYTYKVSKLKLISKTVKFLTKKKKFKFFIVTNQSGIARGKFNTDQMLKFYAEIKKQLVKKKIYINDYQWCPHHPLGIIKKFKKNCERRKPGNQMIEDIIKKWNINREKSFMIGDSVLDQKAAAKSKIKFFYLSKLN